MRPTPIEEIPPSRNDAESSPMQESTPTLGVRVLVFRILLPVLLLVLAAILANWLIGSKPRARRRAPQRNAVLVEVSPAQIATGEPAIVEAMGIVLPAQELDLHPRVRGEVITISPELLPGGLLEHGHTMLRIDPSDYRLAVKQAESNVVRATANIRVEQGNQSIAKKEYELLGQHVSDEDRDLVLRKPQLDTARAALETAQAVLAQAQLDLQRTAIKAPFNAVVRARHIALGTRVTETTNLATLIGTDRFWISASVPVDELKWLRIPQGRDDEGSEVRIYDRAAWGMGVFRSGRVLRLAPDLEREGRMARLIVEVDDPMAFAPDSAGKPRMLIGSYVEVEIIGAELQESVVLERRLLRDGNQVWILDPEGKLDIRQVEIALLKKDRVLVSSGIAQGDQVVITDLPTPVQGMPLRTHRGRAPPVDEPPASEGTMIPPAPGTSR